jgi:hypothetical protein
MSFDDARRPPGRRGIPPYASFHSFERFLHKAGVETLPARVDKPLLSEWGIAAGNESGLLTTLKALGIIDDAGSPTDLYRELRLSQPRRVMALRRATSLAYPSLSSVGEPLDEDRLYDYFVEERGLTGQMVDKASRFYRQLVEALQRDPASAPSESGRRAPASVGQRTRWRRAASEATTGPPVSSDIEQSPRLPSTRKSLHLSPIEPQLTLVVKVDVASTEDDLTELFRRLRRAWERSRHAEDR